MTPSATQTPSVSGTSSPSMSVTPSSSKSGTSTASTSSSPTSSQSSPFTQSSGTQTSSVSATVSLSATKFVVTATLTASLSAFPSSFTPKTQTTSISHTVAKSDIPTSSRAPISPMFSHSDLSGTVTIQTSPEKSIPASSSAGSLVSDSPSPSSSMYHSTILPSVTRVTPSSSITVSPSVNVPAGGQSQEAMGGSEVAGITVGVVIASIAVASSMYLVLRYKRKANVLEARRNRKRTVEAETVIQMVTQNPLEEEGKTTENSRQSRVAKAGGAGPS